MEILLSISGTKIPVNIPSELEPFLRDSNSELRIELVAFPNGMNINLANEERPNQIVYKAKVVSITSVERT